MGSSTHSSHSISPRYVHTSYYSMSLPSPVLSSSTGALNAVRSASSAKLGGSTQWSMSVLNSIQGEQPQQQHQQQAPAVDLENIGTFTHRANRKPLADSSE